MKHSDYQIDSESVHDNGASPLQERDATVDRKELAALLMKLFGHWQLSSQEQLLALGLAPANRAALARLRRGGALALNRDTMERAAYILHIHKNLRLQLPQNPELAYAWIKRRNKAFENRTPMDVIGEDGFAGLLTVSNYLDRTSCY